MRMENTAVVSAVFAKTWATQSKVELLKCHAPRGSSKTQESGTALYQTTDTWKNLHEVQRRNQTQHFHLKATWKFLAYLKRDYWKASVIDTVH